MNTSPTTYAIRVDGHLDDHWSAWLGDLDMTRDDDGTTTITVSVADQAQLHGVLARLRDIGAVITEVRTAGAPSPAASRCLSARCTPSASHSVPRPPATPTRPGGSGSSSVKEWLTGGRADLDAYRKLFSETARLATTVIVTLSHDATAPLTGDFMLRRENAWAQLDVADQACDTQALHREKGGLRAPALPRRHSALLRLARHDVLNVALPHGASRRAASGPEGPAASRASGGCSTRAAVDVRVVALLVSEAPTTRSGRTPRLLASMSGRPRPSWRR